jgi:hypothetical protein
MTTLRRANFFSGENRENSEFGVKLSETRRCVQF